jgi:hypothetical protein
MVFSIQSEGDKIQSRKNVTRESFQMTTASATAIRLLGLGRKEMSQLTSKARRLGVTPERYVRALVKEDLALDHRAKTTTLLELLGPGRPVDEKALDDLVEAARTRHHRRKQKKE